MLVDESKYGFNVWHPQSMKVCSNKSNKSALKNKFEIVRKEGEGQVEDDMEIVAIALTDRGVETPVKNGTLFTLASST